MCVCFSASRRYQASEWLRQMDHGASSALPKEPSEEDFCLALRNGLILCNVLNKVNPGAVLKVIYIYIYIHTPTFVSCPCFIASKTVLNNLHVFKSYNKLIKNLNNSPRWAFLSNHFFLHVNFDMHARNSKCFLRRKTA